MKTWYAWMYKHCTDGYSGVNTSIVITNIFWFAALAMLSFTPWMHATNGPGGLMEVLPQWFILWWSVFVFITLGIPILFAILHYVVLYSSNYVTDGKTKLNLVEHWFDAKYYGFTVYAFYIATVAIPGTLTWLYFISAAPAKLALLLLAATALLFRAVLFIARMGYRNNTMLKKHIKEDH